jgi:hypothetical protein
MSLISSLPEYSHNMMMIMIMMMMMIMIFFTLWLISQGSVPQLRSIMKFMTKNFSQLSRPLRNGPPYWKALYILLRSSPITKT